MSKPVVAITPTLDLKPVNTQSLKNLVANKDELDWIVFTSPTTIVSLNKFYPDFLGNLDCKIAVIGNKTGRLVEKQGLAVDLMPEEFTAEGLIEEFKKNGITDKTIGIPRTASARPVLPEELEKLGNTVILAEAYKSLFPMDEKAVEELIQKIENKEIDAITFTSPLTVENFFTIADDKQKIAELLNENLLVVSIGPITARVLDKYEVKNIYPDTYTVPDMMELLFETLNERC